MHKILELEWHFKMQYAVWIPDKIWSTDDRILADAREHVNQYWIVSNHLRVGGQNIYYLISSKTIQIQINIRDWLHLVPSLFICSR